jgi:hypothetical protein
LFTYPINPTLHSTSLHFTLLFLTTTYFPSLFPFHRLYFPQLKKARRNLGQGKKNLGQGKKNLNLGTENLSQGRKNLSQGKKNLN